MRISKSILKKIIREEFDANDMESGISTSAVTEFSNTIAAEFHEFITGELPDIDRGSADSGANLLKGYVFNMLMDIAESHNSRS